MSVLRITYAVPSTSSSLRGTLAASVSSSAASASASSSYFSSSCALPFRRRLRGISCFPKLRVKATTELAERRQIMHAERFPAKSCEAMQSRPLLNVMTKEDLFATLKQETEAKHLPDSVISALEDLFENYRNAVLEGGKLNANEIVVANMAMAFDRILLQFEEPYTFSSYHKAIREPFDYYIFGQDYVRPLIDLRNSYVGNIEIFEKIENQLRQGENIILISNHQTEADPAVISLLLEKSNPMIAEEIIYVAGDRVIHDPVFMPFSLGRNLLCVYSKKHINDVPELAEMKKKANTRTLEEMSLLLRKGGQLIWIAPSGGRDRPDPDTMEWVPPVTTSIDCNARLISLPHLIQGLTDKFDEVSLDNMRRLVEYSGVPGHMHPLALLCYEVMPPPLQVEREIGEKRKIGFHGIGISIAPEISFSDFANTHTNENEAKKVYANSFYDTVVAQYGVLQSAIYGGKGISASTGLVKLSQPWEPCTSSSNQT